MTTPQAEQRVHTRSQYFLLQADGAPVSLYAFRPADAVHAVPALVVDMSQGGMQILSATASPLEQNAYRMELHTGDSVSEALKFAVGRVWSRPDGMNMRSGFAFADDPKIADAVGELLAQSEHRILRCVLYPQ